MPFYKLSNKEKQVMIVLWNSPNALTGSDICKVDKNLNVNTVQASLTKLLKNKFIEVNDIVYSGTVLAREYKPLITMDDYAAMQIKDYYNSCSKKESISNIVNYFLNQEDQEDNLLDELQKIIDSKK
ncbi:MAG: BlaI/MecI/CopY family transcriptional regulator [Anaerorhabdus sp.]